MTTQEHALVGYTLAPYFLLGGVAWAILELFGVCLKVWTLCVDSLRHQWNPQNTNWASVMILVILARSSSSGRADSCVDFSRSAKSSSAIVLISSREYLPLRTSFRNGTSGRGRVILPVRISSMPSPR